MTFHRQLMNKPSTLDRQMNDENAIRSLEAVIEALKSSISMQKAVANNLIILERLRAYGYSNGFISTVLSKGAGKKISPGLLASMIYRARMKISGVTVQGSTKILTPTNLPKIELAKTTTIQPVTPISTKNEIKPHPFANLGKGTKNNGDRRRNDFTYDPTPNLERIYPDMYKTGGNND